MRRAREDLDRIVEDLLARTRSPGAHPAPGGPGPEAGTEISRQVAAAADAIEARVGEAVDARLGAAERRLQLQAQALEAALGDEAQQARVTADRLEEMRAALDGEFDSRRTALLEDARGSLREIVGDARAELEGKVSELEGEIGELKSQLAATGRVTAERAASVSASVEDGVARLGSELEELRRETSRRSIRRERKRLEEEGARQRASLNELGEARRAELDEFLKRESAGLHERISGELDAGLAAAVTLLDGELDEVRGKLEESASARVEAAVAASFAGRSERLEEHLEEVGGRLSEEAERRVEAAVRAAEGRLAAAERAQRREEEVNRRIEAAKAAAEERVRAAERRLIEVLDRVATAGAGPA